MMDGHGTVTLTLGQRAIMAARAIGRLKKDGRNEFHKYDYVSEAAVKAAVGPALAEAGLFIERVTHELLPLSTFHDVMVRTTVIVSAEVAGQGDLGFVALGSASDKGDKAIMKAQAAGLKYALTSGFLIATGDDPEADVEVDKAAAKADVKRPAARAEHPVTPLTAPPTPEQKVRGAYARIQRATTVAELDTLALELSGLKAEVSVDDYNGLRDSFKARKTALVAAKEETK